MASRTKARLPLIARLLPRAFRERIIEPAYADLLLDQMESHPDIPRRFIVHCVFILECFRLGLPAWLWWQGKPTRFTQGLAAGLALFALFIWIVGKRLNYGS